jgi:peroxiredoxin
MNLFFFADNKVNLEEVCSGKKVVIFGVPGAFTPGCSKAHLPGMGIIHNNMVRHDRTWRLKVPKYEI